MEEQSIGIEVRPDERKRVCIPHQFRGIAPGDKLVVSIDEGPCLVLTKPFGASGTRFEYTLVVDKQRRIAIGQLQTAIKLKRRSKAIVTSVEGRLQIWAMPVWRRHQASGAKAPEH
ncbi:MAG: AbrB/MazE/SpoVT family DNA-binding domain-containing protein [Parcubacteria group bacterium]|nr:AbrB/MazE/SpoVT family DNA-binding domain-containing protein [Parcubacteria group bacterium]